VGLNLSADSLVAWQNRRGGLDGEEVWIFEHTGDGVYSKARKTNSLGASQHDALNRQAKFIDIPRKLLYDPIWTKESRSPGIHANPRRSSELLACLDGGHSSTTPTQCKRSPAMRKTRSRQAALGGILVLGSP
jgi:hypothetical protein